MRPRSIASRENPSAMSDAMYDLGFDVTPFINAATQIGKSAAEIEAIRKAGKSNSGGAAPVVIQQAPSRGIPPIVWGLGLAVLGVGGFLLLRNRGGNRRRR